MRQLSSASLERILLALQAAELEDGSLINLQPQHALQQWLLDQISIELKIHLREQPPGQELLLPVDCALSRTALEDAARLLSRVPYADLRLEVHPVQASEAKQLLRNLGAQVEDNPFAPYINLSFPPGLADGEWWLCCGANRVGSKL